MRPTLRQLEYIVTVSRLGRFSLAAEVLNVSQPSLSTQIATVEQELGVRIFERNRGGIQVTAKGEEFILRAQKILAEVKDLRHAMSNDMPVGGRLRLGVLPSIGPYLLPQAIKQVHRIRPGLRIVVREENTLDLEQGLKSGRFDLILSTPEDHPNTVQHRLFNEPLWVAVAVDDVLARDLQGVSATDLQNRIFLTLDQSHRLSRIVYALAAECGGVVSDEYEGTTLDSIVLMAASGVGVAVLPDLYARRQGIYRDEVRLRPLSIANANRDIALLARSSETPPPGQNVLTDSLRTSARSMGLSVIDP
ncbi:MULTISPECIES: hydrogen peroxide-inducible genes activator [unclassified Ruegeria]|jgi:LysR family hydrogen peroxide-inducible transcriptional activator|uniref:hydrogen peroxide-inducible genes activator n=1 Tax=unclassified Ruegeria TaxID=2625375 RepID=UPI00126984B3|nr:MULTISPECIES: hydrogen peroxide-inducible genes activator [unclassified Ruegeria]NOC85065.1 LysR family transcriptional regulator [Ruegeria sp. HKCCD6428]QFT74407.1 Hydrogen peroxide-inducible genes activator [Ruegeria sp. THAF33]